MTGKWAHLTMPTTVPFVSQLDTWFPTLGGYSGDALDGIQLKALPHLFPNILGRVWHGKLVPTSDARGYTPSSNNETVVRFRTCYSIY